VQWGAGDTISFDAPLAAQHNSMLLPASPYFTDGGDMTKNTCPRGTDFGACSGMTGMSVCPVNCLP
jgi:hypothetical protein